MKHLFICVFLSFALNAQSQIDPFLGIIPLDQCNFSTPCSYIEIPNNLSNNLWQRAESQKSILSHVGNVMITDSVNPYPINNTSTFEIHWPAWNQYPLSLMLSFHHSMNTDSLMDGGIIEVSRDHGSTWINAIEDQTNMLFLSNELYTSSDTLFNGEKGFSGTFVDRYTQIEWIWAFPIKDMPSDTMYYRFRFISDSVDHQKEGWMISDLSFAFVDLGSGINELSAFNFDISPNPSNGNIEVTCPYDIERAILSDLNGVIVSKEMFINKKALNYSGLSKGIYFIQLKSSDGRSSQVKRIMID